MAMQEVDVWRFPAIEGDRCGALADLSIAIKVITRISSTEWCTLSICLSSKASDNTKLEKIIHELQQGSRATPASQGSASPPTIPWYASSNSSIIALRAFCASLSCDQHA